MPREIALYEIPQVFEKAAILDSSVLQKYNSSFAGWNERAKAVLGRLKDVGGVLAGSSPLMFVRLHNSGALLKDARLSTRQDLEKAIGFYANANGGANFTEGIYTDFGLALRTAGDSYAPNDALAKKLAGQLNARGIKLGEGVLIPISALTDKEDKAESYGLTLDLNEFATKETIQDLREFTWEWQRSNGLACAGRGGCGWGSDIEDLDGSGDSGRVVVVRAEGTPQKILEDKLESYSSQREGYVEGLKKLRERIDADLRSAQ